MPIKAAITVLAALTAAAAIAAPDAPPSPSPAGLWQNPHASVVVRTGPCGGRLCGWVIWANGSARADAREGGTGQLIGAELLQDFTQRRRGDWIGTVFVPDMGRHFYSEVRQISPNTLKVSGCILHGLICKSQIWNRVDRAPNG